MYVIVVAGGGVKTWGRAVGSLSLGNGAPAKPGQKVDAPEPLAGVRGAVAAAAGASHVLILAADGAVRVWGTGNEELLGNGNYYPRGENVASAPVPQVVEGADQVRQLSLGVEHALALRHAGTVLAWGRNREGQIGDGTREPRPRPVRVPGGRLRA